MQFALSQETNRFIVFPCSTDLAQLGFSWSNLCLLIPEPCLKESGNPETPSDTWFLLLSQGEPSDPTQRSIHLPVHPPSFTSSRSGVFSPRKKGQFSNWRSQELAGSLPANQRRCGEGLSPLPPYPASHSVSPSNKSLTARFFFP
ncbi:hypothetical protein AMECASPLE_039125 [Ameca splendens]|uniref:Uncharacterized protein n=1 Tax=Ameca splendens TaxID=208324 RepID=A0ABV0XLF9_9TELE